MSEQIIAFRAAELEALHGAGPLAVSLYLHLRAWMDYGTGVVGRSRPVSLAMLAAHTETHVTRGSGVQIAQESEKVIRVALARLVKAGLLSRLAGDRLLFSLPLARTASARPKRTGQGEGTASSTELDAAKPALGLHGKAEPGTESEVLDQANRAHIRYQVDQNLTRRHVDSSGQRQGPVRGYGLAAGRGASGADASHDRLLKLGARRGIEARPGESWADYRQRLVG